MTYIVVEGAGWLCVTVVFTAPRGKTVKTDAEGETQVCCTTANLAVVQEKNRKQGEQGNNQNYIQVGRKREGERDNASLLM